MSETCSTYVGDEKAMFTYSTSLDENQIRVAEIQPGKQEDDIRCRLVTIQRGSGQPYKALSYVWGNPDKNLHEAMIYIRSKEETVRLWTDAICINQEHLSERNEQVQRMGYTYQGAVHVLIWLGSVEAHKLALAAFCDIVKTQTMLTRSDEARVIPILREVLCRTWFQRLWVFQEALLSWKVTVMLGDETCDLEVLFQLDAEALFRKIDITGYDLASSGVHLMEHLHHLGRLAHMKSWIHGKNSFTQFGLLMACQGRLCVDPRDHVFGTTGIAQLYGVECEGVDYGLSTSEVYTRCMKRALIQDINGLVDAGAGYVNTDSGIPSWATNWARSSTSVQFYDHIYHCGGTGLSIRFSDRSFSADGRYLYIPLYLFDIVKRCSAELDYHNKHHYLREAWDELESSYLDDPDADDDHSNPYGDYLARKEAFWRTLIANCRVTSSSTITNSTDHQTHEWPREDNGAVYEVWRNRAVPMMPYRSEADTAREISTFTSGFQALLAVRSPGGDC